IDLVRGRYIRHRPEHKAGSLSQRSGVALETLGSREALCRPGGFLDGYLPLLKFMPRSRLSMSNRAYEKEPGEGSFQGRLAVRGTGSVVRVSRAGNDRAVLDQPVLSHLLA